MSLLNPAEEDLKILKWLAGAKSSVYGECKGTVLTRLIEAGLAEIVWLHPTDSNKSRVALTGNGRTALLVSPIENRLSLDTADAVYFYEQDHYYLSSFSAFEVAFGDLVYKTAEHAYHCQRFLGLSDMRSTVHNLIYEARSAHEAFALAQRYKDRQIPEWDDVKIGVMRDIVRIKVLQHEYIRQKLPQTGNRNLIENSWRDAFWGWGPNRDGANALGSIWMSVRSELVKGALEWPRHYRRPSQSVENKK